MIDKRYQVFVSSTFTDLKEERDAVILALLQMNCIPSGMELFPAIDEEQFEFIKRVIDDCDYYIIIVAARYGSSVSAEGISYVEKEYDYAVSRNIPVLAFLHSSPESIAANKVELSPEARERLTRFRDRLKTGRLVRPWESSKDLRAEVALSLPQTIRTYPAPGWLRGNVTASAELLSEVNILRKENEKLYDELYKLKNTPIFDDIAQGDDVFVVRCTGAQFNDRRKFNISLSWNEIFSLLGSKIISIRPQGKVKSELDFAFEQRVTSDKLQIFWIDNEDFETIGIQFSVMQLLTITPGLTPEEAGTQFWQITEAGRRHLHEIRAIRKGRGTPIAKLS